MSLSKFALTAFAVAAISVAAQAGTITGATGPFKLNGKETTLQAGKTLATKQGDVIDTLNASVSYRSDTGDDISLEKGTVAEEHETNSVAAAIFLKRGSATGTVSDKTMIGAAAGWANATKGGRSEILVDTIAGKESTDTRFRAKKGAAGISYRAFSVTLLPENSISLAIDSSAPGYLSFQTGQTNPNEIEVSKLAQGGKISALVPKATLGWFSDEEGDKTKICSDPNSLKTAKIKITTKFRDNSNEAAIGPGTCALINNQTGTIEVLFTAVKFEILERAISLTTEFATLAQSNFSDVGAAEGTGNSGGGEGGGE